MTSAKDATPPEVAFCLFKYFPYGGLQRNFLRTAQALLERGYRIRAYTMSWEGAVPDSIDVHVLRVRGLTNHGRYRRFERRVEAALRASPVACTVGFNRMPGLDVYYAADLNAVTWTDESEARELTSAADVLAAEAAGELTIEPPGVVINMPFVVWDGGQR